MNSYLMLKAMQRVNSRDIFLKIEVHFMVRVKGFSAIIDKGGLLTISISLILGVFDFILQISVKRSVFPPKHLLVLC